MKRIGIVGGLGPEATVDYYKEIINAFKNSDGNLNYPEILIYSVNMSEFIDLMTQKKYEKATEQLLEKIDALQRAGADFAAISANTPHMLFESVQKKSTLPLISIVEATCDEAVKSGLKRIGLFGTAFTMNGTFYADVFKRHDIEIVVPNIEDRELINHKLFSEIELGVFKDETRQLLIGLIEKMVKEKNIDSLILGCTEFPLILKENYYAGIPMLNTTAIHVDKIVRTCLEV
jgi:aspartate racemase